MRVERTVFIALILAIASGCAHKLPEPSDPEAGPHVTWAIGAGVSSGDELHVCQSAPRTTCELGASSARLPVRTSIHLHLHSGDNGAIFDGEMRATFLSGVGDQTTKVQTTLFAKREASAGLTGIVVDKPGAYEFSYSVAARGVGVDKKFEDRVEVIIR